jgi:hypothetical protein
MKQLLCATRLRPLITLARRTPFVEVARQVLKNRVRKFDSCRGHRSLHAELIVFAGVSLASGVGRSSAQDRRKLAGRSLD